MKRITLLIAIAALFSASLTGIGAFQAPETDPAVPEDVDGYWECPITPESYVSCSLATIRDAALVDASNGWAVGDGGLILRYRNGQWGQIGHPTSRILYSIALTSVNNGWAVGVSSDNRGGILKLQSGQWSALSPVTPSYLYDVAVSGSNAWAVGDDGVTLFYDGSEWLGLGSPTTQALNAVALTSPTSGWAVGNSGTILRLSGGNWSVVTPSLTTQHLEAIALVSQDEGWAMGHGGVILRLSGGTWSVYGSSPTTQPLYSVGLMNSQNGWAVGENGTILQLTSGLWTTTPSPREGRSLYAVTRTGGGDFWAFGTDDRFSQATILQKLAGQSAWSWFNRPRIEPWQIKQFVLVPGKIDDGVGYAAGWNGNYDSPQYNQHVMVRMVDGNWTQSTPLPNGQTVNALALVNANNGWAVGNSGGIWRLSSGGWQQVTSPTTRHLYALALSDINNGWAAGQGGVILRLSSGAWSEVTPVGAEDLASIALNGNSGFMVGSGGAIARYVSALGQWARITSPTTNTLRSVALSSSNEGWAVGDNVTIRLTSGAWSTASNQGASAVALYAPNRGWAVGSAGILRLDGGIWTTARSDLRNASRLTLGSDSQGWAVNTDGKLLWLNGGQWLKLADTTIYLNSVALNDAYNGWAVGQGIWRLEGGIWRPSYSPTSSLTDVALSDQNYGWAVGENGVIARLQNGVWSLVESPTNSYINSIAISDANHGWALAGSHYHGVLLRLADGTWSQTASPTSYGMSGIALSDADNGWAVGGGDLCIIMRLSNGLWSLVNVPCRPQIPGAIALSDANNGWAVGAYGALLRLRDGVWSSAGGLDRDHYGIDLSGPRDGWAVGGWHNEYTNTYYSYIARLTGDSWTAVPSPADRILTDVALDAANAGWAVGDRSTIIRYCPQAGCSAPPAPPTPTPTPTVTPTFVASTPAAHLPLIVKAPIAAATSTPTATPVPGPCERYEPNNTLATAWGPIGDGGAVGAALCTDDPEDYYYVNLANAATLTLDLTNVPAGTDYDLYLYAASGGNPIGQSNNTGNASERIVKAVSAGRYFVRVYPYIGRSSQSYRLAVSWSAQGQAEETPQPDSGKPPVSPP